MPDRQLELLQVRFVDQPLMLGPIAAATATFVAFYKGTRLVVEGLKDVGVNVDDVVKKTPPVVWLAEKIAGAGSGPAHESRLLENQLKVLAANGIHPVSKSPEEVDAVYQEFSAGLRLERMASHG